ESGFPVLWITVSPPAVFIPILFLGGIVGRLFHEFAVTIAVSILVSGFVSLTLTPMLASRFLRPPGAEKDGRTYMTIERGWDWIVGKYERSLRWVMGHRRLAMGFSFAILAGTVVLFKAVSKGFIPSEDTGQLFVTTEAPQGVSFDEMVAPQREVAAIAARDTNIAGFMSAVGGSTNITGA